MISQRKMTSSGVLVDRYQSKTDLHIRIIDAHNHIGMDIHGVTQEPNSLIRKMARSGVKQSIIFPFNEIKPGKAFSSANDYIARVVKAFPQYFIGFARTDPTHPMAVEEVYRAIKKLGLRGLKLHPRSQDFKPSDEEIIPVLEMCIKLNAPILFHAGYAYHDLPPTIGEMADRFPDLVVIMGHMGCSEMGTPSGVDAAIHIARRAENIYLETSRMMIPAYITKAVRVAGADKVIFGSDTPYGNQEDEIDVVLKSEVHADALKNVFNANILSLLARDRGRPATPLIG